MFYRYLNYLLYKIQNTKYKIQNTKYKIQNTKYYYDAAATCIGLPVTSETPDTITADANASGASTTADTNAIGVSITADANSIGTSITSVAIATGTTCVGLPVTSETLSTATTDADSISDPAIATGKTSIPPKIPTKNNTGTADITTGVNNINEADLDILFLMLFNNFCDFA
jgi:hypothetical protein